jgi:hypothetical protein
VYQLDAARIFRLGAKEFTRFWLQSYAFSYTSWVMLEQPEEKIGEIGRRIGMKICWA